MKYAVRTGGIDALFVTLLDVLDAEPTVKICTAYDLDGEIINNIPASNRRYEACKPIYEELPG
jgi:adenylosuccinate synthase